MTLWTTAEGTGLNPSISSGVTVDSGCCTYTYPYTPYWTHPLVMIGPDNNRGKAFNIAVALQKSGLIKESKDKTFIDLVLEIEKCL